MVMMVVMVSATAGVVFFAVAVAVMAMFPRGFRFQGDMADAQIAQCLADRILCCMGVNGDDVHGGIQAVTVDTPDVDMVNIFHAINSHNRLFDLFHRKIRGDFLQK